jgi:uncharacterized membrane protein SpoIIM required for sporulation
MVLESLSTPFKAVKHPGVLLLFGFVYSTLGLILAINTFPSHASIVYVAFIVLASVPLMYAIIKEEEKKDVADFKEIALLKEHGKALWAFMNLFFGVVLGTAAFYVFAPLAIIGTGAIILYAIFTDKEDSNHVKISASLIILAIIAFIAVGTINEPPNLSRTFDAQIVTLNALGNSVTGQATDLAQVPTEAVPEMTGEVSGRFAHFLRIFSNNLKVLLFCILFSFLYGSGAIFVLTWNATVIGVAIGNYIRSNLAAAAQSAGLTKVAEYFAVINIGLLQYTIHGIPEILSYFVAGLAGGIISIAVIRHDFKGRKFEHIVLDAADLVLLSLALVFIAGILEVWVTPFIF